MKIRETDIAIVGAGSAGLSAAYEARCAGAQVLVLDENRLPGGRHFSCSLPALRAVFFREIYPNAGAEVDKTESLRYSIFDQRFRRKPDRKEIQP